MSASSLGLVGFAIVVAVLGVGLLYLLHEVDQKRRRRNSDPKRPGDVVYIGREAFVIKTITYHRSEGGTTIELLDRKAAEGRARYRP